MPTVTNGNVDIHYEDTGGEGRPVDPRVAPQRRLSWSDLTPGAAGGRVPRGRLRPARVRAVRQAR